MQCLLRRSSYKWWFVLRGLARVSASCTSSFQASVCVLNNEAEEVKICKGMVLPCTTCNRQCTSCKKQCKSCKEAPVQVVQEIFKLVFVCWPPWQCKCKSCKEASVQEVISAEMRPRAHYWPFRAVGGLACTALQFLPLACGRDDDHGDDHGGDDGGGGDDHGDHRNDNELLIHNNVFARE